MKSVFMFVFLNVGFNFLPKKRIKFVDAILHSHLKCAQDDVVVGRRKNHTLLLLMILLSIQMDLPCILKILPCPLATSLKQVPIRFMPCSSL
jgi:hypothetical protein